MRVVCEKNVLAAALGLVQRGVATKSPLPALKGILIEAESEQLIISATDLEHGIKCYVDNRIDKPGAIVLPAKLLTEFVRKLPDGQITISADEDNPLKMDIAVGKIKFNITGYPAEEFPRLPKVSSNCIQLRVPEGLFREMLFQTEVAIARDDTRPVLTGLLLQADDEKLKLVATDGHRLAYRQSQHGNNQKIKAIVPGKVVQELTKILEEDNDREIIIKIDQNIVFDLGSVVVSSRLVEGSYPPYQQIIPTEFKTSVVAETKAVVAALERAEVVAREGGNSLVTLRIVEGMAISTASPDVGRLEDFVEAQVQGEELEIKFNVRLLLDCLRNIKANQVNMDFTGSFSPCMVKPVGDHNYLHLVLPVRV